MLFVSKREEKFNLCEERNAILRGGFVLKFNNARDLGNYLYRGLSQDYIYFPRLFFFHEISVQGKILKRFTYTPETHPKIFKNYIRYVYINITFHI